MSNRPPPTITATLDIADLLGVMKQNLVDVLGHVNQPIVQLNPDVVAARLVKIQQLNDALRHLIVLHAQAEANQLEPTQRN